MIYSKQLRWSIMAVDYNDGIDLANKNLNFFINHNFIWYIGNFIHPHEILINKR